MTKPKSTTKKAVAVKAKEPEQTEPKARFYKGVGGRKSSVALVRLFTQKGDITVNGKPLSTYFSLPKHQAAVTSPVSLMNQMESMSASVQVRGGGVNAQAEAVRHGIARALVAFNEEYRKRLRKAGFMTRDAREVERKKPGLKKARKAPQWAKR